MNQEIVRNCERHGDLTAEQVYARTGRNVPECRLCIKERNRVYYERDRIERLKDAAKYREAHRERLALWAKEDRAKNPEKYRARSKAGYKGVPYTRRMLEILNKRGITLAQYEQMHLDQDNKCSICKQFETCKDPVNDFPRRLSLDHCHATGKVRGLLCHSCNTAIGKFKDNINLLQAAMDYLLHHKRIHES